ncbi:cation transporter [Vibrio maritimus]|uniref:Cation transport ATPase n=1 Tax=Vibrio maritimus TaxID=990268 RepID=A0A090RUJ3_9VIBR|nr:cation transporter [Vibrio sp. SCSIO 43140]USD62040.1 cation transporter [Vibrio sp. SCSIO 43140]GAL19100.1 cation transport ATPase [Vibrio maritimus]
MERDCFGICLDRALLSRNRRATFTHVRAYQTTNSPEDDLDQDVQVSFASPQMSGSEVLKALLKSKHLLWRAGYVCPSHD